MVSALLLPGGVWNRQPKLAQLRVDQFREDLERLRAADVATVHKEARGFSVAADALFKVEIDPDLDLD